MTRIFRRRDRFERKRTRSVLHILSLKCPWDPEVKRYRREMQV